MGLLDELRRAIRQSGELPARIAERAGLPKSALSRLLAGRGLAVDGVERIARAIGYRVELRRNKRKGS